MPPTSTSLPLNVMQFARILRCAGLPIGPDKVITSLEALQVIDIGNRADVFWALHAVFVKRHAHSELFRLAFDRLWTLPELAAAEISVDEPHEATRNQARGYASATPHGRCLRQITTAR